MLDRNPSGGYLTNGRDSDGVIVSLVPGGRARRPSVVIHSRRFCRECGVSFSSCTPLLLKLSSAPVTLFSNHNHSNNRYSSHRAFKTISLNSSRIIFTAIYSELKRFEIVIPSMRFVIAVHGDKHPCHERCQFIYNCAE